jgi:hypothetical protein
MKWTTPGTKRLPNQVHERSATRRRATPVLLLLFFTPPAAQSQNTPPTLRSALSQAGVSAQGLDGANLEKPIGSWAELNNDAAYLIAYFVAEESNRLDAPLFVHRYDKRQHSWTSTSLPEARAATQDMNVRCFGSVLAINEFQGLYLLNTHQSPSAGCLLILNRDLKWKTSLYGWFLTGLGKDRVIYHRSQIHFAPVHSLEMGMYDLAADGDLTIFPPQAATPIRDELTRRLGEFFVARQNWCSTNNHPCDPTWFDSALVSDVAVNAEQDALAFVVSYEAIQDFREEKPPAGPSAVLYVYRHVSDSSKRQLREILLEEAKRKLGVNQVQEFLAPDRLSKLFEP